MGPAQIYSLLIARNNNSLIFDKAHASGMITTYSANNSVTDSAAGGTALACGSKTNNYMLGIRPDGTHLKSLISYAQDNAWTTGLIVTCELTNATPAAFYAHTDSRDKRDEIANYLLDSNINIIIGGGIKDENDSEYMSTMLNCFSEKEYHILEDSHQISETDAEQFTLFMKNKGLLPTISQGRDKDLMPQITEDVLNKLGDKNFFLMIEGSQIDLRCHANDIHGLVGEMSDFENVVSKCFDFADKYPGTLVIVTADHETGGLTIVSGSNDFSPIDNIGFNFTTTGHTGTLVPIYTYGPYANRFIGTYDNTQIFYRLMDLLKWEL